MRQMIPQHNKREYARTCARRLIFNLAHNTPEDEKYVHAATPVGRAG
jgi:hypothetical protein